MSTERHSLPGVIGQDLLRHGKLPLILFFAVIISAIYVVTTAQKERLVLEKNVLDIEWRNLILEENALADHSRVERFASEQLGMVHVDPTKENIVVTK